MVKIDSTIGMKFRGKIGDFIIQDVNGRQVLRQGYKENKTPTKQQIEVRDRFREAAAWVKSLSPEQKKELRKYYRTLYNSYEKGQPSTWYNWAKTLHMTTPDYIILDQITGEYKINHPGILKVEEISTSGIIVYSSDNLSSIINSEYLNVFTRVPNDNVSFVRLTTISGAIYDYGQPVPIVPPSTSCIPCMRGTCFELRAVDASCVMDNCWQLDGDVKTHFDSDSFEYGHFL